jgi:O-antigen ligase
MKDFLRLTERGFIVFALLYFTGAFNFLAGGLQPQETSAAAPDESSPLLLAMRSGVLLFTFFLVYTRWQNVVYVASRRKFLWAFVGLLMASTLWSAVPNLTLRRSLVVLGATFFALYLSARYSLREQMRLLAWAMGIAVLLNFVFMLAFPSLARETAGLYEGTWRGIFAQKNVLARIMLLSALNFLLVVLDTRRYRYLLWIGFGMSIMLLLLANSKTALAAFLVIVSLIPLFRALRWNYSVAIPFFTILLLVSGSIAILLIGNTEAILSALGRDITLTGRTGIWAIVLDKIGQHPWLGYGFEGFWLGMEGESADIWYETYFMAPNAHNGFLDLALALGLIGLLFFMLSFLRSCLRAVTWLRLNKTTEGLWAIVYLTFLLFCNITESVFLEPNYIFFVLYVAITTSILVQPLKIGGSEAFDMTGEGFNKIRKIQY